MTVKSCPICGTFFNTPPTKNKEHCSKKCRAEAALRRLERPCLQCGKLFYARHLETKHCSKECKIASARTILPATCPICGKLFNSKHGKLKYCSLSCRKIGAKKQTVCENCGKAFEQRQCRSHRFCSRECSRVTSKIVACICETCGKEYELSDAYLRKRRSRFCSLECRYAKQSAERRGANNVNYRGGSIPYRGRNWRSQSRLAKKRDGYKCQICGKMVGKNRHDHGVHHIVPYRFFDGDYETANRLSNLITLCGSCHRKVEFGTLACPRPLW